VLRRHVAIAEALAKARSLKTRAKKAHQGHQVPVPDGDVADFAIVLAKEDKKHASMYIVDLGAAA
jgi:alkylation response protein AidB-like acyl-CoA dehydrogenase